MKHKTVNTYLKEKYGHKIYKIALNGGFTCPNRDGTIDTRGCIFCSGYGSGDFAEDNCLSISEQIERGKNRIQSKMGSDFRNSKSINENNTDIDVGRYIAYFQAFTNTYAPISRLREVFMEAINNPDIVILSIATRPDCLGEDVLELLDEINHIKPVWVELGLQTIHDETARYIRRGYPLSVYDEAVNKLNHLNIDVITHVILGLPGENKEAMLQTVRYVCGYDIRQDQINDTNNNQINNVEKIQGKIQGIKLQLLHVLKGTDLAKDYEAGLFKCMTLEEYTDLVAKCISILPEDIIIHRMTGDGAKKDLIAPLWSADKKRVLNTLNKKLSL
ncbi:MAG: TIGR01212 family radical SAM protein [Eubacterium sp.]|nr:TIGR01212 family radical SAM protein [Eubacterium sp.]